MRYDRGGKFGYESSIVVWNTITKKAVYHPRQADIIAFPQDVADGTLYNPRRTCTEKFGFPH